MRIAGRCCLPLVAAAAVTVAVSRGGGKDGYVSLPAAHGCLAIVPANSVCWQLCWLAVVRGAAVHGCCTASSSSAQAPGPKRAHYSEILVYLCGCDICLCSILDWFTLLIRKAIKGGT
jgi:hypothetical protein